MEGEFGEEEPKLRGPLKLILGLFLLLIIISWIIPHYAIKIDPAPSRIPSVSEVFDPDTKLLDDYNLSTVEALRSFGVNDPVVKQAATKIATISCEGSKVCHAKAIYYFVRDNIEYVADPVNAEYVEQSREVLSTQGGDCESGALLMASLLNSDGVRSQIIVVPGHAFVRVYIKDAAKKYKQKDEWIYLDWTCSSCNFGEFPNKYLEQNMQIIDV